MGSLKVCRFRSGGGGRGRSEVGGRKSEVGSRKSEVGGRRSEVGGRVPVRDKQASPVLQRRVWGRARIATCKGAGDGGGMRGGRGWRAAFAPSLQDGNPTGRCDP
jgi:hypothetical protein